MKKILSEYNKKVIVRTVIIVVTLLFLTYFIVTLININHYLNEYGYGIKELSKTVSVYFHLSKGFTVEQNEDGKSVFIGRHDYIYDDILNKKGYYKFDMSGSLSIYTKIGYEEQSKLYVLSTNDWCHWFRIYVIDGAKIEDFL